ncbi:MAG TPA: S-layer homology domain-containing protein [Candidatus Gracilibacteria bacterium]|nr:S-layer homology domain-containing protein [Candidatus Gracilibacteria bacterium]
MVRRYKNKITQKIFEHKHSRGVFVLFGVLVVSMLFLSGTVLHNTKVQLRGAAPGPVLEARIQDVLNDGVFTDVPGNHKHAYAIAYLKSLDLVRGYEDGTFRPDNHLTRAEFMVFLMSGLRVNPHNLRHSYCFADVSREWFAPATCFSKSKGWIEGDSDNRFMPSEAVTNAVALKVVLQAFEVQLLSGSPAGLSLPDMPDDAWYVPYVWAAASKGLLGDNPSGFSPDAQITRGELAQLLYSVMVSELPPFGSSGVFSHGAFFVMNHQAAPPQRSAPIPSEAISGSPPEFSSTPAASSTSYFLSG